MIHTPLTPYITPPRHLEWLALVAILILAAALRLGVPGVVEFRQDEANLSRLALDMARGQSFPLLGIDSSVGIRNTPMSVYVMVPPFILSSDPILATSYVGLLNVVAVLLTYFLARRYYGPPAALVAGLLYAIGPWAVAYSRKIWAQELLPPFVLLTIATGLLGFVEGKRRAQLLHLPLLFITAQIHYVTFALIPVSVYLIIQGRKRLTRAFAISIVLAALTVIPFGVGAVRAGLLNPEALSRVFTSAGEGRSLTLTADSFLAAVQTVGGADLHALLGDAVMYFDGPGAAVDWFAYGLAMVVIAAAMWLAVRAVRKRDRRAPIHVALLIWLVGTPIAFSITWTPVYAHYMIPILPAAFLITGAGCAAFWHALATGRVRRRVAVVTIGGALVAVVAVQVWLQVAVLTFVNAHATPGGFSTPLGWLMPVQEAILTRQPAQVLARLDGQFIGYNEQASIWDVLLSDVPLVRFLDGDIDVFPAELALTLDSACTGSGDEYYLRSALDTGATEGCYALGTRPPPDFDAEAFTPAPDAQFINSARLIGFRWEPETGCLYTAWTTEWPAAGPVNDFFNVALRLMDGAGQMVAQADGAFWNGRYWRAGDVITRRYCMGYAHERIADIVGAGVGLYTIEDTPAGLVFHNVDVIGPDGTPIGHQIEIRFE
jgi:4-amino-4-deoxy-L-arabinose transferase-like glycosyltransferase